MSPSPVPPGRSADGLGHAMMFTGIWHISCTKRALWILLSLRGIH